MSRLTRFPFDTLRRSVGPLSDLPYASGEWWEQTYRKGCPPYEWGNLAFRDLMQHQWCEPDKTYLLESIRGSLKSGSLGEASLAGAALGGKGTCLVVGGGTSLLSDEMFHAGFQHLVSIDISAAATEASRARWNPQLLQSDQTDSSDAEVVSLDSSTSPWTSAGSGLTYGSTSVAAGAAAAGGAAAGSLSAPVPQFLVADATKLRPETFAPLLTASRRALRLALQESAAFAEREESSLARAGAHANADADARAGACAAFQAKTGNNSVDDAVDCGLFDTAVDKGLVDAFWASGPGGETAITAATWGIGSVMKPGGTFILLSFTAPSFLIPLLCATPVYAGAGGRRSGRGIDGLQNGTSSPDQSSSSSSSSSSIENSEMWDHLLVRKLPTLYLYCLRRRGRSHAHTSSDGAGREAPRGRDVRGRRRPPTAWKA